MLTLRKLVTQWLSSLLERLLTLMTGGTPVVRSDKSLTLLIFDIWLFEHFRANKTWKQSLTYLIIERSEECWSWEWRRRREEKGERSSFHDFALFRRIKFWKENLLFNLTHPNERKSKWVGAYSWMVKHLPSLILTWDDEQEKAISAPDSCLLDGSNYSVNWIVQKYGASFWLVLIKIPPIPFISSSTDYSHRTGKTHIPFVCHLNLGVFHCGWTVQQWQCPFNVFLLIDSTTINVKN